jgi:hypothetical protein
LYQPLFPEVPLILGVMTGGVVSTVKVTVLSVLVEAVLPLPAASIYSLGGIEKIPVPLLVKPLKAPS